MYSYFKIVILILCHRPMPIQSTSLIPFPYIMK